MSRDASIDLDWADGTYKFRLGIAQIRELQEKCDAGPVFILERLVKGTWRVDDLLQTIRIGLIGGGTKPEVALRLVRTYVEGRPLLENVQYAQAILGAALVGAPDEPVGKTMAETDQEIHSQMENSDLPPSTELPD